MLSKLGSGPLMFTGLHVVKLNKNLVYAQLLSFYSLALQPLLKKLIKSVNVYFHLEFSLYQNFILSLKFNPHLKECVLLLKLLESITIKSLNKEISYVRKIILNLNKNKTDLKTDTEGLKNFFDHGLYNVFKSYYSKRWI